MGSVIIRTVEQIEIWIFWGWIETHGVVVELYLLIHLCSNIVQRVVIRGGCTIKKLSSFTKGFVVVKDQLFVHPSLTMQ